MWTAAARVGVVPSPPSLALSEIGMVDVGHPRLARLAGCDMLPLTSAMYR